MDIKVKSQKKLKLETRFFQTYFFSLDAQYVGS